MARERLRPDVQRQRVNYAIAKRFVEAEDVEDVADDDGDGSPARGVDRFVFIDESGARTEMTRTHGRSLGGQRCVDTERQRHWDAYTMTAAMGARGVLRGASLLMKGAMDGVMFLRWVRDALVPALRPGQIVVMDNLGAHKVAGVEKAIEAAGCSVWYLPPYSPDLNPIEKLWSKVKAWLRRVGSDDEPSLERTLCDALNDVSEKECLNYLRSCGYGTS